MIIIKYFVTIILIIQQLIILNNNNWIDNKLYISINFKWEIFKSTDWDEILRDEQQNENRINPVIHFRQFHQLEVIWMNDTQLKQSIEMFITVLETWKALKNRDRNAQIETKYQ